MSKSLMLVLKEKRKKKKKEPAFLPELSLTDVLYDVAPALLPEVLVQILSIAWKEVPILLPPFPL